MWSHGYNPPPCYAEKVACCARSSRKPKRNSSCAGSVGPLNIIQGAAALFCTTTHISPLYSQDSRLHTRPPPPRPDMGRGSFSSRRAGGTPTNVRTTNVGNDKRQNDKRQKGQTSEATNVRKDKRQKRQTSETTNVRRDKRQKDKRRKNVGKKRQKNVGKS